MLHVAYPSWRGSVVNHFAYASCCVDLLFLELLHKMHNIVENGPSDEHVRPEAGEKSQCWSDGLALFLRYEPPINLSILWPDLRELITLVIKPSFRVAINDANKASIGEGCEETCPLAYRATIGHHCRSSDTACQKGSSCVCLKRRVGGRAGQWP